MSIFAPARINVNTFRIESAFPDDAGVINPFLLGSVESGGDPISRLLVFGSDAEGHWTPLAAPLKFNSDNTIGFDVTNAVEGQVLTYDVNAGRPVWRTPAGGTTYTAGTGLTLTADQFALADTSVAAGAYTYASVTVDQQGRITSASNGVPPVSAASEGLFLDGGAVKLGAPVGGAVPFPALSGPRGIDVASSYLQFLTPKGAFWVGGLRAAAHADSISVQAHVTNDTGSFAVEATDTYHLHIAASAVSFTLPTPSAAISSPGVFRSPSRILVFRRGAGAGAITLLGPVDGATDFSIADPVMSVTLMEGSGSWYRIAQI